MFNTPGLVVVKIFVSSKQNVSPDGAVTAKSKKCGGSQSQQKNDLWNDMHNGATCTVANLHLILRLLYNSVGMKITMRIQIAFLLMLLQFTAMAQNSNRNNITLSLQKELYKNPDAATSLPVLVQGETAAIELFLRSKNLQPKFIAGDILSAELNTQIISELRSQPFVKMMDCPKTKLHLLNDVMVIQNNVDSAYNGIWPLDQSYDGTDVIIGIIDAPFDFNHPDFTDAFGNTRITYLWDQTISDPLLAPDDFAYGVECDSSSIADGTCPHIDYNYWYSHGSGVTGVAASSGNAANNYRGVAPNAQLVLVALDFNDDFLSRTIDAIAYVYQKAAELGKPCVINTSFGSYDGAHDGKDLATQTINNLIAASPGRSLVAAAGNGGDAQIHLGYNVTETAQFTWFKKLSYTNAIYFQAFADTADFNGVYFSIGADNPSGWIHRGHTPDYNVLTDYSLSEGGIDSTTYNVFDGPTYIGNVSTYIQLLNGTYFLEVVVIPAFTTYYWRFTTHGAGKFDVWSTENYTGYSNYVTTGLPTEITLPEIVNYRLPDYSQNIVGYWQCSDNVITVGSYVNRDTMTNYYGAHPPLIDPVGDLFYQSSFGPTRDDRIKPDIAATGSRILTTGSDVLTSWLISLGAANYMSPDGMHYLQNGTSFASPVVAGIAALYFQKHPDADWQEVKNAILTNAKKDVFTGDDLPDNAWGYGKANAFRTLTGSWGCSAEDYTNAPTGITVSDILPNSALISWNLIPNAAGYQIKYRNLSTGVTIKKKTTAINKIIGPLTSNTDYQLQVRAYCSDYGSSNWCDPIYFSTPAMRLASATITIYPNPAQNNIQISGIYEEENTVTLMNTAGEVVFRQTANADEDHLTLDVETVPNGFYIIAIYNSAEVIQQTILISR